MSDGWKSSLTYAEKSDVGMRRANNQDSVVCQPATTQKRYESYGHLFVVADGMGAHAAGELASQMATEQVAMHYLRGFNGGPGEALKAALAEANEQIYSRGQSNPEFHQMGTTTSALVVTPSGGYIAHVGDSRVYRLRGNQLEQMTFDHSLSWEVAATGQSNLNIPSNVITRSLGPHESVDIDVEGPLDLQSGDRYLLCSDGLTGPVEDSELAVLLSCLSIQKAADVLIDLANLRGGPDNITLIVVEIGECEVNHATLDSPNDRRIPGTITLTMVLCLIAAAVLAAMGMYGPAIVAGVLALVTAGIAIIQSIRTSSPIVEDEVTKRVFGGGAPYRRYDASPNATLYEKLGETITKLREAADEHRWLLDWTEVDRLTKDSENCLAAGELRQAIRYRAETVIETMSQLREQQNQAANETAIE